MSENDFITVEIYGQSYTLGGADRKDYVLKLAKHLDSKMNQVADSTGIVDSLKVAILAGLGVADDYFQVSESGGEQAVSEERINKLIEVLDDCIE